MLSRQGDSEYIDEDDSDEEQVNRGGEEDSENDE